MKNKPRQVGQNARPKRSKKYTFAVVVLGAVVLSFLTMVFFPSKTSKNTAPPNPERLFNKEGQLTIIGQRDSLRAKVDIEIAEDEFRREVGLMGRPSMEQNQGMLFVFPDERPVAFWMKNTILPLDMIFITVGKRIVTIHKNTTPFSEQTYPSDGPVMYVLEVNAGFTDRNNVRVGDLVKWERE
ncbi:MAG: DUF192 domain-containing protein [Bacteroidota bacterium]